MKTPDKHFSPEIDSGRIVKCNAFGSHIVIGHESGLLQLFDTNAFQIVASVISNMVPIAISCTTSHVAVADQKEIVLYQRVGAQLEVLNKWSAPEACTCLILAGNLIVAVGGSEKAYLLRESVALNHVEFLAFCVGGLSYQERIFLVGGRTPESGLSVFEFPMDALTNSPLVPHSSSELPEACPFDLLGEQDTYGNGPNGLYASTGRLWIMSGVGNYVSLTDVSRTEISAVARLRKSGQGVAFAPSIETLFIGVERHVYCWKIEDWSEAQALDDTPEHRFLSLNSPIEWLFVCGPCLVAVSLDEVAMSIISQS